MLVCAVHMLACRSACTLWKHSHFLFFLMRRVTTRRFVVSGLFFFFSLTFPKYDRLTLFVFDILILVLIVLISNGYFWPFYKSFVCFQFSHSILIWHIYIFFQFDPYSFNFYFFPCPFVKVLLIFNFILQFKFLVYYFFFQLGPCFFDFLSKCFWCSLIYILFQFSPSLV